MSGDTIFLLIMVAVILFLAYEFLSVVKERDEYREKYNEAECRLDNLAKKFTSLMYNQAVSTPPATKKMWRFIHIDSVGDTRFLRQLVDTIEKEGYTFDPEASNTKYMAFRKIITIEPAAGTGPLASRKEEEK